LDRPEGAARLSPLGGGDRGGRQGPPLAGVGGPTRMTPAMAAGIARRPWNVADLLAGAVRIGA